MVVCAWIPSCIILYSYKSADTCIVHYIPLFMFFVVRSSFKHILLTLRLFELHDQTLIKDVVQSFSVCKEYLKYCYMCSGLMNI